MNIEVYKFGGVAVGSADAIRIALQHVAHGIAKPKTRVAAVVSAMNGVTDLLLDAANAAREGDAESAAKAARAFFDRHEPLIGQLIKNRKRGDELRAFLTSVTDNTIKMTESIAVLRELTPRAQDALVARGERMLARFFTAAAQEAGIDAVYVDATEIISSDRALGPDFAKAERAAKKVIAPHLTAGRVVIMPGYIGSGPDGEVVTLGRGGTDFSAAILARSLNAKSVTLFKEVDGLMTADPKRVPQARVLAELHYREAAELAYYGAKVLHPRTMIPLVDRKIPLYVRNTFSNEFPGTRIAGDVKAGEYPVKALTAIHGQALVAIEGNGMIGVPGVAARAFTALSNAGHSVSMISQASSESSICFVVPEAEQKHAIDALNDAFARERQRKLIDRIGATHDVALIAVVGLGMRHKPGIAARTFSALSGARVNVVAIAQGSSELNITIAVTENDADSALIALHNEFQLDKLRPLADVTGRESKLTLLGFGQIGRALARQLNAQSKHLRDEIGVDIRVIAVADRSGIEIQEEGFSPVKLERMAKKKESGARLFEHAPRSVAQLQEAMAKELWLLPSYRPILVDLTSDETEPMLKAALENGFHVVTANKKPLAVSQEKFDALMRAAKDRGLSLRYEATAGAGLPVLDTLAKLADAGDRVESILGCFSGTLGYLMTELEKGRKFSDAVHDAWKLGYTEPDPRDDLSGMDVARKALILARTLGRRVEPEEIAIERLFTDEVDDADPKRFIEKLRALDDDMAKRVATANREGKTLRYVARIERDIRVGLEAVPKSSPLGGLQGTANQVVIHSKRYSKSNPLVVTGPGAGADVTAAGVLNDIVAITVQERRRR